VLACDDDRIAKPAALIPLVQIAHSIEDRKAAVKGEHRAWTREHCDCFVTYGNRSML
jgi:hypothetical protein